MGGDRDDSEAKKRRKVEQMREGKGIKDMRREETDRWQKREAIDNKRGER